MPVLPMTELPVCSLQLPLSTSMSFHENYNKTKQNPFKAVFHQSVHALPRSPKVLLLLLGPKNTSLGQTEKEIKHETHSNSRPRPQYAVGGVHLRHVCLICVCKQHEERRKNKDGIINSQKGKRKQKKKTAINIFLPLNTAAPLFCH